MTGSFVSSAVPGRRALTAWLLGRTRILPALLLAALSRTAGRLLLVAMLLVAASALLRIAAGAQPALAPLALTVIVLSVVKAALRYLEHYAGHWAAFTALQRLRELLFTRLIPQAPAATTGRASAEITELATRDIDRIEVFFAHTVPPAIAAITTPAIALTGFAVLVDPVLATIVAAFLLASGLVPLLGARASWAAARAQLTVRGRVATHVADDVQGIGEILGFDAGETRLASLQRLHDALAQAGRRTAGAVAIREIAGRLLWGGCLVVLLLSGRELDGIVLAIALTLGLWFADSGIDDFATGLDAAFAAAERVWRVCEAEPAVRDLAPTADGAAAPSDRARPATVELRRVDFAYPSSAAPALHGVDARFDAGRWHYVAGVSGSGKSTLATLLIRAWDPLAGTVLLDGVPLPRHPIDEVRAAVAVVDQRPVLFPGSVADNLRLARPDAVDTELHDALEVAGLPAADLPDGLTTAVAERGASLSGGQLQRLVIARALVARPRVLVLDEALSQLDAATAGTVRRCLAARLGETTVIEITHRTDVIPADTPVLVIDRGRAVEHGSAGDLRERGGAFARLSLRDDSGDASRPERRGSRATDPSGR